MNAPPATSPENECFTCSRELRPGDAYHRLRIGLDLAPNFDAVPPEHQSTVEEETVYVVCEVCQPAVSEQVDQLLSWLWRERPGGIEPAVSLDCPCQDWTLVGHSARAYQLDPQHHPDCEHYRPRAENDACRQEVVMAAGAEGKLEAS